MVNLDKCSMCPKKSRCKMHKLIDSWIFRKDNWTQKDYAIQAFLIFDVHVSDVHLATILAGRL